MRSGALVSPPRMGAPLRLLASAIVFLTRVPLPPSWSASSGMLAGAPAFPLVGALLGALVGGTVHLLAQVEPALAAAAIAVAAELMLTGALHLDGLADSADSLGAQDRGRALEIMRDHTLGTYGVSAIALDLLTKVAALSTLAHRPLAAVVALSLSRSIALPIAFVLPYARGEEAGVGYELSERLGWPAALLGIAIAALIAVVALGAEGVVLLGSALLVATVIAALARRRLGGITGDVLGASIELAATACLLIAAGWVR